jgi:hypothetical protein
VGFSLLALACREDIALQLFCLWGAYALPLGRPSALVAALGQRRGRLALGLFLAGLLLYFFGYIVWLQPHYVPTTGSYGLHFAKLGQQLGVPVRSGRELVAALLLRPGPLLGYLLDGERLRYPLLLAGPLLLLPLLAPRPLAGLLPVLAINLLSSFPLVLRLESHYTTALVPFVVGAGLIGSGRLGSFLAARWPTVAWPRSLALALLLAVGVAQVFHGGSPLALFSDRFDRRLFAWSPGAAALRQAIAAVPATATVAARPGPLAHLCQRRRAISPPEFDDGLPVDVQIAGE